MSLLSLLNILLLSLNQATYSRIKRRDTVIWLALTLFTRLTFVFGATTPSGPEPPHSRGF